MKTKAYYHVYMPDDESWSYIFIDQMREMIESGLVKKLNDFHVVAIGNKQSQSHLLGLLYYYNHITGLNISLNFIDKDRKDSELHNLDQVQNNTLLSETATLQLIHEECKVAEEPYRVLYFHAKGVTSIERVLKTGQYHKFINFMHWRKHLEWGVFDMHEKSMELLSEYDAVSTNYDEWPCPHYSGNFWWANSNYIKTLSNPNDDEWWSSYKNKYPALHTLPDRLVAEMWIGSGENPKLYSHYNDPLRPPISNMGDRIVLKNEYYK